MLIHEVESNISTKEAGCHSDSTREMKILRNGSAGAFSVSGEISFLYQWNHLMPLLTRYEKHPVSTFQSHFITKAHAALLPVLGRRTRNTTVSLNDFYFGSTGGFVEVAYAGK